MAPRWSCCATSAGASRARARCSCSVTAAMRSPPTTRCMACWAACRRRIACAWRWRRCHRRPWPRWRGAPDAAPTACMRPRRATRSSSPNGWPAIRSTFHHRCGTRCWHAWPHCPLMGATCSTWSACRRCRSSWRCWMRWSRTPMRRWPCARARACFGCKAARCAFAMSWRGAPSRRRCPPGARPRCMPHCSMRWTCATPRWRVSCTTPRRRV